jgi:hypothetical protein
MALPPARNRRATASVIVGLAGVLAVPAGVALARYSERVTLVQAGVSAAVGALLGLYALLLSSRGRETLARTLGRSGGSGAVRVGKALGVLALCLAATAGVALGSYALLIFFAD